MFNLFSFNPSPTKTAKEILEEINTLFPNTTWVSQPSYTIDGNYYTANELMQEFIKLKDTLKSIEEDGTKEHNEAVELRQQNAHLKVRLDELNKEVLGLRHLKEENVQLMERINENSNAVWESKINVVKNDNAVLKAKLQIVQNDYKMCAEQRDEYKHQLNAANKEIEALKRWREEQLVVMKQWDEVDQYIRYHKDTILGEFIAGTCLKFLRGRDEYKQAFERVKVCYEEEAKSADKFLEEKIALEKEIEHLRSSVKVLGMERDNWHKLFEEGVKQQREVEKELEALKKEYDSLRTYVDGFVNVENYEVKAENNNLKDEVKVLKKGIIKKDLQIDELKIDIEKLKEDIIDYVIKKDEEQKHPMYPLHWGGYDGAASAYPKEYSNWLNDLLIKAKELTKGVEVDLDKSLDEQCDEVKKPQSWSTFKVTMNDAVQEKQREIYGVEEVVDALKNMKTQGFEDYDPSDFIKTEKQIAEEELLQKELNRIKNVEFNSEELLKRVTDYAQSLPKTFPDEFQEDSDWQCPCNICKKTEEESQFNESELEKRVKKLEKKIEELILIKNQVQ